MWTRKIIDPPRFSYQCLRQGVRLHNCMCQASMDGIPVAAHSTSCRSGSSSPQMLRAGMHPSIRSLSKRALLTRQSIHVATHTYIILHPSMHKCVLLAVDNSNCGEVLDPDISFRSHFQLGEKFFTYLGRGGDADVDGDNSSDWHH